MKLKEAILYLLAERNGGMKAEQLAAEINHRQGAFTYLYETVRAFAKQEGSTRLRLYVDHSNRKAQKCYKKQGMDECHYLMYEEKI